MIIIIIFFFFTIQAHWLVPAQHSILSFRFSSASWCLSPRWFQKPVLSIRCKRSYHLFYNYGFGWGWVSHSKIYLASPMSGLTSTVYQGWKPQRYKAERATLAKRRYTATYVEISEDSSPVTQLTWQDVGCGFGGNYNYSRAETQIARREFWMLIRLAISTHNRL